MNSFLAVLAGSALAQDAIVTPDLDAQTWRPPIDGESFLWTDDTTLGPEKEFFGRVFFDYARDPLVYTFDDGERIGVVSDLLQMDLVGATTLGRVRLGADVPLLLRTGSETLGGETGLGDVAIDTKVAVIDRAVEAFGLGLGARITAPTATVDAPLGWKSPSWEVQAIVDKELGPVVLACNFGTRGLPEVAMENVTWDDQLFVRAGGAYALDDRTGVSADLAGDLTYTAIGNRVGVPLEGLLGGWRRVRDTPYTVRGGMGTGLTPGIGAPRYRAVLALAWEPRAERPPEPEAWVAAPAPPPPPPPDTDSDGLHDADDRCPNAAEDADGWQDADGCPEVTTVNVRVVDPAGAAVAASLRVGADGGAVPSEGLAIGLDEGRYPVRATAEGYIDYEGELSVGAGAPVERVLVLEPRPPEPSRVIVTRERIELRETVLFETARARVLPASYGLLDDVAAVLRAHPEVTRVRIEGHTDSRGAAASNLELSRARAGAVADYLVAAGIAPGRLESEGFGESRPLDPREVPQAWEKNRRVEFFVVQ